VNADSTLTQLNAFVSLSSLVNAYVGKRLSDAAGLAPSVKWLE